VFAPGECRQWRGSASQEREPKFPTCDAPETNYLNDMRREGRVITRVTVGKSHAHRVGRMHNSLKKKIRSRPRRRTKVIKRCAIRKGIALAGRPRTSRLSGKRASEKKNPVSAARGTYKYSMRTPYPSPENKSAARRKGGEKKKENHTSSF